VSGYRRGAGRELRVKALYEANGWVVYRSAGSHGAADLVAMKAGRQTELIQVKATAAGPYASFGPAEREELRDEAIKAGARAVLCWYPPDRKGPRYLHPQDWPEARAA
jgi:Holliday junction resolvase